MSDIRPLDLPFDPFDPGILREALAPQRLTFLVELAVIAILVTARIRHGVPRADHPVAMALSSGWCSLPFFFWGFSATIALSEVLSRAHPSEVFVWWILYGTALCLALLVVVQGLTVAVVSPHSPSLGLTGRARIAVVFTILTVLLDSFSAVYHLRVGRGG
jgi:hypothetical protein